MTGGFEFNYVCTTAIRNNYKKFNLIPIKIHFYDNTWHKFIQIDTKYHTIQITYWNHHKNVNYNNIKNNQEPNDNCEEIG